MSLLEYYFQQQEIYQKKYGENTVVFLMKGSFYEVYSTHDVGKAPEVAKILNIALTKANKNIPDVSKTNPFMMGVPLCSSKKHIKVLLNNLYTIVTIDQKEMTSNTDRFVAKIYSPGTVVEDISTTKYENNYTCSIYYEVCDTHVFGISFIDLSTGKSHIYEVTNGLSNFRLEELYRIVESYSPTEISVFYENSIEEHNISKICDCFENDTRITHKFPHESQYSDLEYQRKLLNMVYDLNVIEDPIEHLGLEMLYYGRISFVHLLQFVYEHDEKVMKGLQIPTLNHDISTLLLNNNSCFQLGVINNTSGKSLFDIINKTSTVLGKRKIYSELLHPITCSKQLNKTYDYIENMKRHIDFTEQKLKYIVDTERLCRKIVLENIQPVDIVNLFSSYENALSLMNHNSECTEDLETLIDFITTNFDLSKCHINCCDITCSIFSNKSMKTDQFKNIFDCEELLQQTNSKLEQLVTQISKHLKKEARVNIDGNSRSGYYMYTTVARGDILKKALKDKGYEFKTDKSKCMISNTKIKELFHNKTKCEEQIKPLVIEKFMEVCSDLWTKFSETCENTNKYIAHIDSIKSKAKCAVEYGYSRPFVESTQDSYFIAKNLRHPIVEQLNMVTNYVPCDVVLDQNSSGILLYGVNGAGKSCYSKSIGLCIVLAQSGNFVPSSDLKLGLFNKLYTRISDNDNIYRGQSSFFVEMSELKSIVHYSDSKSIVLGDEVCKGTEDVSAVSIVSTTLKWLLDRKSKFVFATHLHNLPDVSNIKNHPQLNIKHLAVTCDTANDFIEYTRELKDGKGETLYGVEIARAIINNEEFIKETFKSRNEVLRKHNKLLPTKKSKYNSSVFVNKCEIPGCESTEALDSHHIIFQKSEAAKSMNIHGSGNLVVLCKAHHHDVHSGKLIIHKWKNTTKGKILDYQFVEKQN